MGQLAIPQIQKGTAGQVIFSPSIEVRSNGATEANPGILVWRDDGLLQANITSLGYGVQGGGTFHANFARGTRAAPSQVLAGDITGGIGSRAYNGVDFQTSSPASIHWQVTQNQTPAQSAMWMRFLTTPKGSVVRQERGGVTDNGVIWSHDTSAYDATLDAQTKPTADTLFLASATAPTTGAAFTAIGYGAGVSVGFRGISANGTPAVPTASQDGDILVFLGGQGYGATAFSAGSRVLIAGRANQAWTDAAQGTRISFEVTPNGTAARAVAFSVNGVSTTGAQNATFVAANKPGAGAAAPISWLPVLTSAGVQGYIPIFGA